MARADQALYRAKNEGRNRVAVAAINVGIGVVDSPQKEPM
jgi:hypothetical protein